MNGHNLNASSNKILLCKDIFLDARNGFELRERKRFGAMRMAKDKFIYTYVDSLLNGAVAFFTSTDAVITLQRCWRGYITRVKNPIPIRKIKWKERGFIPRYGPEVYRRMWAQRHFEPSG